MIQLHTDYLVFETAEGDIPCAVEEVAIELVADSTALLDPDLIREAAAGVLHYFKEELGKDHVSVGEFATALEKALQGLGLSVKTSEPTGPKPRVVETDLKRMATESGEGFELAFFPRLRREVEAQTGQLPCELRFTGLRACVKTLAGSTRWNGRCQRLSDQIVDYLRSCLSETKATGELSLVVR